MNQRAIGKILIANRGEIAVRIIRTCREMGIRTVAVYSDIDRTMPHVLMADEAYLIGAAPPRESYLAIEKIVDIARRSQADAVHPGYGFLSERPDFAERVAAEGLAFVGPRFEAIRTMGDKIEARKLVSSAGVPVVPGTAGPIDSEEHARSFCDEAGLPVLIKAAAGGGGKGMRVVHRLDELASAFRGARAEALGAFGDPRLYLEKYIENPRHIEIQVLGDKHGNAIHLGERECSIQRRHKKLIEETPSVIVDEEMRGKMGRTAVSAAKACGYDNAGTIEFLVDEKRNFYFLEMNTRLQVEHPVTEMRTGIDLVAAQIRIAMGEPLSWHQEEITFRGHAMECRICAEDPGNDNLPSTGVITHLRPPSGIGIREDRGVEVGGAVSVYYDPLISKLVSWGSTREEARTRMVRALREYELLGVKTNIPLHLFILEHPQFVRGEIDTHFLPKHFSPDLLPRLPETSYLAAAIAVAVSRHAREHNGVGSGLTGSAKPHSGGWKSQRSDGMRN